MSNARSWRVLLLALVPLAVLYPLAILVCRVRDLLQDSAEGLPNLHTFEAAGVRNVRNHLIEHPGRHKGVKVMAINGRRMRFSDRFHV